MMVMSAICWGSWANTYKGVKNYRFELFYWDYAVGIFVTALVLAFTLGSTAHDSSSFLANVHSTDTMNFWYALAGGAVFNIANLLLVAGIDMAGLAVAFPVAIGIALVVGVVTTYIRNPEGSPLFLSLGVLSALVAVVLDGKAYSDLGATGRTISRKSIVVCVVSGILMGFSSPWVRFSPA
jgi:glucose uptake protein